MTKIKRIIELNNKKKLKPTERKEYDRLLDEVIVFYNSKKHQTTISGGGLVSLWLRYVEGNKKWKQGKDETIKPILEFEKEYKVRLYCNDIDNSQFNIRFRNNSLLVKE